MRVGFYAGSFDPVTLGHRDLIHRSLMIVDRLVIGIGCHASKTGLFTSQEREELLRLSLGEERERLRIVRFSGLTITAAREEGASVLIRGLRDEVDCADELRLAGMNHTLAPDLETVFLAASAPYRAISATLVRQAAQMGADVSAFVPPPVCEALKARFASCAFER
jgi:pantetheine-phosphate adenylyltransferase